MDFADIPEHRLAVGAAAWDAEAMAELAGLGFTHLVNVQAEHDNRGLAAAAGLGALWNPTEDDLTAKPPAFFERSARFAVAALAQKQARVYVHCAAGVHRGPITTAAILCALGHDVDTALQIVAERRDVANFPEVYVTSLRQWARRRGRARRRPASAVNSAGQ